MAVSKKQQKCVNKYIDNHYDRINLTVKKGHKELIQEAAKLKGVSVNTFINSLIDTELARVGLGFGSSEKDGDTVL